MGSGLLWSVAVPSQLSPSFPPPWIPVNSCIRGISTTSATLFFFFFFISYAVGSLIHWTVCVFRNKMDGCYSHTPFLLPSVMLVLRIHLIKL